MRERETKKERETEREREVKLMLLIKGVEFKNENQSME